MKKIIVFTVISCLLATSLAFAKKKKAVKKHNKSYSIVQLDKAKHLKKHKKAVEK